MHFASLNSAFASGVLEVEPEAGPLPDDLNVLEVLSGRRPVSALADLLRFVAVPRRWRPTDFVSSGTSSILVSERFVRVVEEAGLTGFDGLPVEVSDRQGRAVPGYRLMRVTGSARRRAWSEDEVVEREVWNDVRSVIVRGPPFEEASWDGSDFFAIAGEWGHYCSGRAAATLTRARLTNLVVADAELVTITFDEDQWDQFQRGGWSTWQSGASEVDR